MEDGRSQFLPSKNTNLLIVKLAPAWLSTIIRLSVFLSLLPRSPGPVRDLDVADVITTGAGHAAVHDDGAQVILALELLALFGTPLAQAQGKGSGQVVIDL